MGDDMNDKKNDNHEPEHDEFAQDDFDEHENLDELEDHEDEEHEEHEEHEIHGDLEEHHEHDDHEQQDDFSEEFDFESPDALAPDEMQNQELASEVPEKPKSSFLPLVIAAGVLGFIGWKGYGMWTTHQQKPSETALEKMPTQTQAEGSTPTQKPEQTTQKPRPLENISENNPQAPTTPSISAPSTPSSIAEHTPSPLQTPGEQGTLTAPSSADNNENLEHLAPGLTPQHQVLTPAAPALPPTPTTPPLSVAPTSTAEIATLEKKIDEQAQSYKQQMALLEKNLSVAVQSSENANKTMGALQNQISSLSSLIQHLSSDLKGMRDEQERQRARQEAKQEERRQEERRQIAEKKVAPKISHKSTAYTSPALTIHAIIPGRAWLKAHDGKTITVSEGDSIGEYGKVLKIDAANALVITSSGVTLR